MINALKVWYHKKRAKRNLLAYRGYSSGGSPAFAASIGLSSASLPLSNFKHHMERLEELGEKLPDNWRDQVH